MVVREGPGLLQVGLLCHYLMMPSILHPICCSLLNLFMAHARPWAIIIIKIKKGFMCPGCGPVIGEKKELFLADLAGLPPAP